MAREQMLVYHDKDFSDAALGALEMTLRSALGGHEMSADLDLRIQQQVALHTREGLWQQAVEGKVPASFSSVVTARERVRRRFGPEEYDKFLPLLIWHPNFSMLQVISSNLVLERDNLAVILARTDITADQRNELLNLQRNHYGSVSGFSDVLEEAKGEVFSIHDRLTRNGRRGNAFLNLQRELTNTALAA